ncbi:MAG: hypothetical protein LBS14_03620 [Holosporaceae bacterium]|nr:hypothetical protein [Holosporaceae bacterium]
MRSLKNKALPSSGKKKLCKIRNVNNSQSQKVKLLVYKSCDFVKDRHLLRRKKIKLHRFKFVPSTTRCGVAEAIKILDEKGTPILSKKYQIADYNSATSAVTKGRWSHEEEIVAWLTSIEVEIKRIGRFHFALDGRICFFSNVVTFANRRRSEMGLEPFYVHGITEF